MEALDILKINPNIIAGSFDKHTQLQELAKRILSRDTGIEIECDDSPDINFRESFFKEHPAIIASNCDPQEKRFRVSTGLGGLKGFYHICEGLNKFCVPTDSGIHLHIDLTDVYDELSNSWIKENENWILSELDTWGYKGIYNSRRFNSGPSWVRLSRRYQTIEFRIVEMTFDYSVLMERVLHAHKIVEKICVTLPSNQGRDVSEDIINSQKYISDRILEFE